MQVKLAIAAMGVALAGSAAAQPYYPYHPYWGPRWVAPPYYQPAPAYPPPVYVPPPAYLPAPAYDHRALVNAIQDELEEHGYRPGPTDGLLDSETVSAIRDYQRDAGLPITGEATPALLDHLRYAQPPVYAQTQAAPPAYPPPAYQPPAYSPPAPTAPPVSAAPSEAPTYTARPEPLPGPYYSPRPAMRGDPDVAWVQSALQRRGYTPGPADGVMGERTRRAIEAFQRDNGMTPDGTIGPNLLSRLR
ncbi:peptidoglycan-binding protein [Stella sp.]|uniref:peptidoglycan-binding domain-containing protein n=1 Tax=Stella sp. TaxID=2912054 RepID=UPI0035AF85AF